MSSVFAPEASAALTANGGTDGYVTVTDNSVFYPGAYVWLSSSAKNKYGIITDLSSTDKIGIRFVGDVDGKTKGVAPAYGRSDCSAFTTAQSARINMEAQVVPVDPSFSKAALL